jgi:protein-serine/threonine kinase
MDWFRWRSLNRDTPLGDAVPAPIITDFDRPPSPIVEKAGTPRVVVTGASADPEPQSVPSSRSASGAHSEVSEATTAATTVTANTSVTSSPPKPIAASVGASQALVRPAERFNDSRLRYHQGAVDQNALTSRMPPAVIVDIRKALWEMGMDVREEAGTFRLKCIRRSQKKVSAQTGIPLVSVQAGDRSSLILSPSTTDTRTGLPMAPSTSQLTASPSSTFRALFGRRGSSTSVSQHSSVHGHGAMPSPALTVSSITFDSPQLDSLASPLARSTSTFGGAGIVIGAQQPLPFYGEDDSGAEIRFSVELSRMKNLSNLYSVDIRRLKGELWAYRGVRALASISAV